ncbi:Periplasmic beta-glucosidase precursor [Listeria grayi]|uniref:glycoside hydrolase family 3 N-terminal domain-containing protein n=1 Tax=Listeria grayi TaxID=1641 RepID=UPI000F6C1029|nr:glycoside hydrolase family 3 N-terminal domain-containing protein [Listeria grayi]VEI33474.1 Periplasmic beta-glucosidase precursor [Listeria grayi]
MASETMKNLLAQMTIEEKVAQCMQLSPFFFPGTKVEGEVTGPLAELELTEKDVQLVGSTLGSSSAEEMIAIQEKHLETSRLNIPLLFMADVIHGYKTVFPIPLALGASFDREAAEEMAAVSAKEATADGLHVNFSPMLDLVRDPRWGRVMESTGEDPYLNSELGVAMVRGYQGETADLEKDYTKMAATVKHFAAYGQPEGGREYNTVDMSNRELYQNYLPAYRAALDAGAKLVMTSFNVVDGVPATMNRWLNRDILRGEFGFDGVLISDWGAIQEVINHGTAADKREAAKLAMTAGVDIEMMTSCYMQNLQALIEDGELEATILDEAVLRILTLKEELGLFQDPYRGLKANDRQKEIFSEEHRNIARIIAAESAVLLENKAHTLPFAANQQVALVGPLADSNDVLGGWTVYGEKEQAVTLEAAFQETFTNPAIIPTPYTTLTETHKAAIKQAVEGSDIVIAAVGEKTEWEGEAGSLATVRLPESQYQLVDYLHTLGKPVVTVLFSGRPIEIKELAENSEAMIEMWFPGTEAGHAVTDLLTGKANPSGKLPMSFPQTTGQIPIYYNHLNTGRPKTRQNAEERYVSKYLDIPNRPFYPFGYGKSYTEFEISDVKLSKTEIALGEEVTIRLRIKNSGSRAGKEVVQIYLQDETASVSRPVRELKGFEKVNLAAGEERQLQFTLTADDFSFYLPNLEKIQEPGRHRIFVGTSSLAPEVALIQIRKEESNA